MSQDQSDAMTAPPRCTRWQRLSPSMGWRAFWSEIVIVVLGVVIALAANEAMEEWNWQRKVADAEQRLQGDVHWAFLWAAEKSSSHPCVDAQLVALSRTVLASGDTLTPSPVISSLGLQYMVREYRKFKGRYLAVCRVGCGRASARSCTDRTFARRISA